MTWRQRLQLLVWVAILIPASFACLSLSDLWDEAWPLACLTVLTLVLAVLGIVLRWGFGIAFLLLGTWYGVSPGINSSVADQLGTALSLSMVAGAVGLLIDSFSLDKNTLIQAAEEDADITPAHGCQRVDFSPPDSGPQIDGLHKPPT